MDGCGAGGDAGATPVVSTGAARGFLKIGAMRITAFASASMVRSGPQGPPLALRLGTVHEYEDSRLAGRCEALTWDVQAIEPVHSIFMCNPKVQGGAMGSAREPNAP